MLCSLRWMRCVAIACIVQALDSKDAHNGRRLRREPDLKPWHYGSNWRGSQTVVQSGAWVHNAHIAASNGDAPNPAPPPHHLPAWLKGLHCEDCQPTPRVPIPVPSVAPTPKFVYTYTPTAAPTERRPSWLSKRSPTPQAKRVVNAIIGQPLPAPTCAGLWDQCGGATKATFVQCCKPYFCKKMVRRGFPPSRY